MNFRPHRSTLAESLAEIVELAPTKQAIADHWNNSVHVGPLINPSEIVVSNPFCDSRIGWTEYMVTADFGVVGYIDGELTDRKDKVSALIQSVNSLLEWMPTCSVGSSGYKRRVAVEKAIREVERELTSLWCNR